MLRPLVSPPLEILKPYTFIMMSDLRPVYPSKEKNIIISFKFMLVNVMPQLPP